MTYTVRLQGILVGRSDLEETDPATGARSGKFRAGPGYALVEPLFELQGDRYVAAMQALKIEVVDDATGESLPSHTVTIRDGRLVV